MQVKQNYLRLTLVAIILISCNSDKSKNSSSKDIRTTSDNDTFSALFAEDIALKYYTDEFLSKNTQIFIVNSKKTSIVQAKKGLKITVNPSALEGEDGTEVNGDITVTIVELLNSTDLFKSNAATVSNGKLLISGGSYYVAMHSKGKKLKLKKNNTVQIEFPQLYKQEMELFYGNRDAAGNMNWEKANEPLTFKTEQDFSDYKPPYPDAGKWKPYKSKYFLYDSLNSPVYYVNKKMTVLEMVNILQKRGVDKNIDTVFYKLPLQNPRCLLGNYERERYLEVKQYRVISCKELEAEKDSLSKQDIIEENQIAANEKYKTEWEKENDITQQIQKYYSPSSITKLGWINVDRFYKNPDNLDVPIEIPITFNKSTINYFIIYRAFNGLVSGQIKSNSLNKSILKSLPNGEFVTLIALTKNNGQLFHCKQDFKIQKNQQVKLDFKTISKEELIMIFGKNVKI